VLLTDSNYIREINILPGDVVSNIEKSDLLADLDKGISLREITRKTTEKVEKEIIKKALDKAKNNKVKAAKILKIDRMTLYSKIKSLGL
jgi:two-component system response regulator HydG